MPKQTRQVISSEQAQEIKSKYKSGVLAKDIGKEYGVSVKTIYRYATGKNRYNTKSKTKNRRTTSPKIRSHRNDTPRTRTQRAALSKTNPLAVLSKLGLQRENEILRELVLKLSK